MELFVFKKNDTTAAEKAGVKLGEFLSASKNAPTLFLASGGSALDVLPHIDATPLGPHVTLSMLDERFEDDPEASNFIAFSKTPFYKESLDRGASVIATEKKAGELLEIAAYRLDQAFKKWKEEHKDGVVISLQGIGDDGHTAGIMPFPNDAQYFNALFENENRWVTGYDAHAKHRYPLRITVTLPFFRYVIDRSVIYAAGDKKHDVLKDTISEQGTLAKTPARIIREMKDVWIYTDQEL